MSVESQIALLLKRLAFLGYPKFQIRDIIAEATGRMPWSRECEQQNHLVLQALQKYERLGLEYAQLYSK